MDKCYCGLLATVTIRTNTGDTHYCDVHYRARLTVTTVSVPSSVITVFPANFTGTAIQNYGTWVDLTK